MHKLALYTDPAQTVRHGLGLGRTGLSNDPNKRAQALVLANSLVDQRLRYTVEPFSHDKGTQIIRTTQELFDGAGTCADFAVTMAALCNREDIPVTLALAIPKNGSDEAHVVVLAHDDQVQNQPYMEAPFQHWLAKLNRPDCPYQLLDTTPLRNSESGDLAARNRKTLGLLGRDGGGLVYTIDVRATRQAPPGDLSGEYYVLPDERRHLGITTYLPDPPRKIVHFPSRAETERDLPKATGRIVIVGETGTGKSTLALHRATTVSEHRGWFLDASDRGTLIRSLVAAEAQSRGAETGPDEPTNLGTLTYQAGQRLTHSERPWVVVMDNANDPKKVADLFPTPRPARSETDGWTDLLIVTTTDTAWADSLPTKEWRKFELTGLTDTDAATAGAQSVWARLTARERLPGLARIAANCAPELLGAGQDEPSGARRIVRAALGVTPEQDAAGEWPRSDMLTAVTAASFMPAERITVPWLTRAVFDGSATRAVAALEQAESAGLLERSRSSDITGAREYAPLWMHRLVRAAVRDLTAGMNHRIGVRVLATHDRQGGYSADEITELHDFISGLTAWSSLDEFLAATTTIDLLEPRGSAAVQQAGTLAKSYVDKVEPALRLSTPDSVTVWAQAQMAIARLANQNSNATPTEVEQGLERCSAVVDVCTRLIESSPDQPTRNRVSLLRGRARAMGGILLRKQGKQWEKAGDHRRAEQTYREAVAILNDSYQERRRLFEIEVEVDGRTVTRLGPDPDRHVDRGWYNLGGTYVDLANLLHRTDSTETGRAKVADALSEAMIAYAGSLSLRRSDRAGKYTAASLWGVGLCAYSAALYCPGRLDLTEVVPTEELNPVRQAQTRDNLLRAAEDCLTKALNIWAEIDGVTERDTTKARDLLRKVSLAWNVAGTDPTVRSSQFWQAIEPAARDLGVRVSTNVMINVT